MNEQSPTPTAAVSSQFRTGLPTFDKKMGGLKPGTVVSVLGEYLPFGVTVALNNAFYGRRSVPVLVLTTETPIEQYRLQLLLCLASINDDDDDFRGPHEEEEKRLKEAERVFARSPICIETAPNDQQELELKIQRWVQETGGGPVVIEWLSGTKECWEGLKQLAEQHGIPIIASRNIEEDSNGFLAVAEIIVVPGTREEHDKFFSSGMDVLSVINKRGDELCRVVAEKRYGSLLHDTRGRSVGIRWGTRFR